MRIDDLVFKHRKRQRKMHFCLLHCLFNAHKIVIQRCFQMTSLCDVNIYYTLLINPSCTITHDNDFKLGIVASATAKETIAATSTEYI